MCFADDTVILHQINSNSDLNSFKTCINDVRNWFQNNHLSINAGKCGLLNFHLRNNFFSSSSLNLINSPFSFQSHYKYLGLIMESNMKFSMQFLKLKNRLNQSYFLIRKLSFYIPRPILSKLYLTYVLPILEYCNINYFLSNLSMLRKINSINNHILSMTDLNIDFYSIYFRLFLSFCQFIYKIANGSLPDHFNIFIKSSRNTRFRVNTPLVRLSAFKCSYYYTCTNLINLLSSNSISFNDPFHFQK